MDGLAIALLPPSPADAHFCPFVARLTELRSRLASRLFRNPQILATNRTKKIQIFADFIRVGRGDMKLIPVTVDEPGRVSIEAKLTKGFAMDCLLFTPENLKRFQLRQPGDTPYDLIGGSVGAEAPYKLDFPLEAGRYSFVVDNTDRGLISPPRLGLFEKEKDSIARVEIVFHPS